MIVTLKFDEEIKCQGCTGRSIEITKDHFPIKLDIKLENGKKEKRVLYIKEKKGKLIILLS
jgi:uncharacterized protein (DUF2249 family)